MMRCGNFGNSSWLGGLNVLVSPLLPIHFLSISGSIMACRVHRISDKGRLTDLLSGIVSEILDGSVRMVLQPVSGIAL